MNTPANQLVQQAIEPVLHNQAKLFHEAEANIDIEPISRDYMEGEVLAVMREKFDLIVLTKERCACVKIEYDQKPARCVFISDLDHNSRLEVLL